MAAHWWFMNAAPRRASVLVDVMDEDGRLWSGAHFACDLSGDESPPFGPGWFVPVVCSYSGRVSYYAEIPRPMYWRHAQ